jgi:hypothetical protein
MYPAFFAAKIALAHEQGAGRLLLRSLLSISRLDEFIPMIFFATTPLQSTSCDLPMISAYF